MIDLLHAPLTEVLGWTLLYSLWELTVIAAAVGIVLGLLTRIKPEARYAVACAALLAMVIVPIATAVALFPRQSPEVARAVSRPVAAHDALVMEAVTAGAVPAAPVDVKPAIGVRERVESLLPAAVLLYLTGALLCSLRLVLGFAYLRKIRVQARAVDGPWALALDRLRAALGIRRNVALLQSSLVEVPAVIGWLRPLILLPDSLLAAAGSATGCPTGPLTSAQVSALLAHELAHIRRHDYLVNLIQSLIETLLFYHPAVWWLSGRIRQEREHCCDDLAVAAVGDRHLYAKALATMESLRGTALAMGAGGGRLLPRIRRLLNASEGRRTAIYSASPALAIIVAIGLMLFLLFSSSMQHASAIAPAPLNAGPATHPAEGARPILIKAMICTVPESALPTSFMPKGDAETQVINLSSDKAAAKAFAEISDGRKLDVIARPAVQVEQVEAETLTEVRIGQAVAIPTGYHQRDPSHADSEWIKEETNVESGVKLRVTASFNRAESITTDAELGVSRLVRTELLPAKPEDEAAGRFAFKPIIVEDRLHASISGAAGATQLIVGPRMLADPPEGGGPAKPLDPPKRLLLLLTPISAPPATQPRAGAMADPAGTTGRRRVDAQTSAAEERRNIAVREKLKLPLEELTVEHQPLERVVAYFHDTLGEEIDVDWAALAQGGIQKETPVSVALKNVTGEKALRAVLESASNAKASLGFTIDAGVIAISTAEELKSPAHQSVRVYDVEDLVGRALPENGGAAQEAAHAERQRKVRILVQGIESTVDPTSWRDAGGSTGGLRELNGRLLVNQTSENQTEVIRQLDRIRKSWADLVKSPPVKDAAPPSTRAGAAPEARPARSAASQPATAITLRMQGMVFPATILDDFRFGWNMNMPANVAGEQAKPDAERPAFGMTIIDNWTTRMLLDAFKASKGLSIEPPVITTHAGKLSTIALPADKPRWTFGIQPTFSADGKYIVMRITPTLASREGVEMAQAGLMQDLPGKPAALMPPPPPGKPSTVLFSTPANESSVLIYGGLFPKGLDGTSSMPQRLLILLEARPEGAKPVTTTGSIEIGNP